MNDPPYHQRYGGFFFDNLGDLLLPSGVQVGVLTGDVGDAGAGLLRVQVVVTYDQGAGVAPVKVLEQQPECHLLCHGTRVGGLTADVESALVAYAYRVGVVVLAVSSDHVLRTSWLYLSVTTDDVVVSDAEVESLLAVPCVDLSYRTRLVGPYCRTVNDN